MDFGTALLYVLAVIAIIFVAGLIIYLLAALVVSIIDKKEVRPFSADNDLKDRKEERLLLEDKLFEMIWLLCEVLNFIDLAHQK